MAATTTIRVPHLGGIRAGYRLSSDRIDPSKPTVVCINSMCTTSALYNDQFASEALTSVVNLLAIEPLGHGATTLPPGSDHFTYWDSATVALQAMQALGVDKAFALGTSQGGWIVARMALLAPDKILGLLPLGTSMDCESADSRTKGCWDPQTQLRSFVEQWTSDVPTHDFVVQEIWREMVAGLGFGGAVSKETVTFWHETVRDVYSGDEGRRKVRMALVCLLERDGLLFRLGDIKCPVYWLQGKEDPVFGITVPVEQIKLFRSSPEASLFYIEGGGHYLNATSPKEVELALLKMVRKYT
ncbi:putative alpha/beta hydrolase [Apodospora peruviana]|uniref:Alpha/beta hydrolase n=1 Tax=Apodospora peruviana TaxID=516989 RepID=A0AAE0HT73_9PEZI|nr:putative alpha/beta hydrolase [Apodospora peruviana]